MRRLIGVLLMLLTAAFLASGCTNATKTEISTINSYDYEFKKAEDKIMHHLIKKYGCQFECIGKDRPTALDYRYSFLIKSHDPQFEGEEFSAYYLPESEEYQDNYWGILIRGEIDALVTKSLSETVKVFSQPTAEYYPDELTKESTLKEAIPLSANIYIFSEKHVDIKALSSTLEETGINGFIKYYCLDKDVIGKLNYTTYQKTIATIANEEDAIKEQDSVLFGK